jgi:hypothetical protein
MQDLQDLLGNKDLTTILNLVGEFSKDAYIDQSKLEILTN